MKQTIKRCICLVLWAAMLLLLAAPMAWAADTDAVYALEEPEGENRPTQGSGVEPQISGPLPENGIVPLAAGNYIWFQGYVYRADEDAPNFKRTYTLTDGSHTASIHHLYVMRLKVDGSWKTAYCLEPDTGAYAGVDYGDGSDMGISGDWKVHLTKEQQQAIGLVLLYSALHHPNNLSSTESVEWEVATQIIIWETVMGMRSSAAPYACTDTGLIDQFTGSLRYNSGDDHSLQTVREKYQTLSGELAVHNVIPSFAASTASAAPVYDLPAQSGSLTLTDSNGVLSDFPFAAPSPLALQQEGNTLTVTAPASTSWDTVTCSASRSLPNPSSTACCFRIFYLDAENQALASPPGSSNVPVEPVPAYFRVKKETVPGTATIRKSSDSGDVEGYCFKLYRWGSNTSWYGKTDSSGKVYLTDSSYSQSGTKTYTFSNLLDGKYTFLEVLSQKGTGNVFPDSWNITVTDTAGKTVYNQTFPAADLTTDANGDCRLNKISITGLTGGGTMTMTIHNVPLTGDLEIRKTSEDGAVAGILFTVEEWVPGMGYCRIGQYPTDSSGKILVPKLRVGTKYRISETVPEGYLGQEPKEITIQAGTNTVAFENRPIYGNLELTKIDEANPEVKLSGAEFTVTWEMPSEDPSLGSAIQRQIMTEVLDANGRGTGVYRLEHLRYGRYTVQETKAPEGYELSEAVFEIHITEEKTYIVEAEGFRGVPNRQRVGSIQIQKVDPQGKPLPGASFLLEYSQDGKNWKPVDSREEGTLPTVGSCTSAGLHDGILVTGEDGLALFSGLRISIGENHIFYRLTEVAAPEGYMLLSKPAFEGELPLDGSRDITITAVNSPQYVLPFTGGQGFPTVTVGLLLAELALSAVFFLFQKKRREV